MQEQQGRDGEMYGLCHRDQCMPSRTEKLGLCLFVSPVDLSLVGLVPWLYL